MCVVCMCVSALQAAPVQPSFYSANTIGQSHDMMVYSYTQPKRRPYGERKHYLNTLDSFSSSTSSSSSSSSTARKPAKDAASTPAPPAPSSSAVAPAPPINTATTTTTTATAPSAVASLPHVSDTLERLIRRAQNETKMDLQLIAKTYLAEGMFSLLSLFWMCGCLQCTLHFV